MAPDFLVGNLYRSAQQKASAEIAGGFLLIDATEWYLTVVDAWS
jgi:hypothetical protein